MFGNKNTVFFLVGLYVHLLLYLDPLCYTFNAFCVFQCCTSYAETRLKVKLNYWIRSFAVDSESTCRNFTCLGYSLYRGKITLSEVAKSRYKQSEMTARHSITQIEDGSIKGYAIHSCTEL